LRAESCRRSSPLWGRTVAAPNYGYFDRIYKEQDGTLKVGCVYVLHLERPVDGELHYVGWSRNLVTRIAAHATGRGAKFTRKAFGQGVRFVCTGLIGGTERDEEARRRADGATACGLCSLLERGQQGSADALVARELAALRELVSDARDVRLEIAALWAAEHQPGKLVTGAWQTKRSQT
jgi:hypothetical protein